LRFQSKKGEVKVLKSAMEESSGRDSASLGEEISPPGSVTKKNQKQMVKTQKCLLTSATSLWQTLCNGDYC
jgi:hypothetical protein